MEREEATEAELFLGKIEEVVPSITMCLQTPIIKARISARRSPCGKGNRSGTSAAKRGAIHAMPEGKLKQAGENV